MRGAARALARHRIKPGITGLAQINGCRGETETLEKMQKRVDIDLRYINTWSLWLDIKIVLRTVKVVATAAGVYGGEGSNWRAYRPGTEAVGGES